jgi:hypothetical protein
MKDESCPAPGTKVTEEEVERRRTICMACEDRRSNGPQRDVDARCRFCGCPIEKLVKWSQRCRNAANPKW